MKQVTAIKRMKQKTYTVRYYEHIYVERKIMASSPSEAKQKMNEMIGSGMIEVSFPEVESTECKVIG